MANLNVNITDETMAKAKAKAALLNVTLSDYIERLLENNTKDIAKIDIKEK